ncbi:MAG: hypothetical protein RLO50_06930 [Azospirillaceae bacterium]
MAAHRAEGSPENETDLGFIWQARRQAGRFLFILHEQGRTRSQQGGDERREQGTEALSDRTFGPGGRRSCNSEITAPASRRGFFVGAGGGAQI